AVGRCRPRAASPSRPRGDPRPGRASAGFPVPRRPCAPRAPGTPLPQRAPLLGSGAIGGSGPWSARFKCPRQLSVPEQISLGHFTQGLPFVLRSAEEQEFAPPNPIL